MGNLPPHCDVIIKLIYVTELAVDDGRLLFRLSAALAPAKKDAAQQVILT